MSEIKTLRDFQKAIWDLKLKTLTQNQTVVALPRVLNAAEEIGELCREERLALDGFPFNEEKAKDAVGDSIISILGYCIAKNWDAQKILEEVFSQVAERWLSGAYSSDPAYRTENADE